MQNIYGESAHCRTCYVIVSKGNVHLCDQVGWHDATTGTWFENHTHFKANKSTTTKEPLLGIVVCKHIKLNEPESKINLQTDLCIQ